MKHSSALILLALLTLRSPEAQPTGDQLAKVTGRGVQIYTCKPDATWSFVAPEAILNEGDTQVGTHGAGPRWTWKDGSTVTGKLLKSIPSPDSTAIPWLELAATPDAAHPGFLSTAVRVIRTDTQGGIAPQTGCDAVHVGTTARVPYTATYTFWTH